MYVVRQYVGAVFGPALVRHKMYFRSRDFRCCSQESSVRVDDAITAVDYRMAENSKPLLDYQ